MSSTSDHHQQRGLIGFQAKEPPHPANERIPVMAVLLLAEAEGVRSLSRNEGEQTEQVRGREKIPL